MPAPNTYRGSIIRMANTNRGGQLRGDSVFAHPAT